MTDHLTLVPNESRDTIAPETAAPESTDANEATTAKTVAPRHPDVTPAGITLPRPWEEYRMEAELANDSANDSVLRDALDDALDDVSLIPQRYAELMWLLDSWFVEDRHDTRQRTVDLARRRIRRAMG